MSYASVADVRKELKDEAEAASYTEKNDQQLEADNLIAQYLTVATSRIREVKGYDFEPVYETRDFTGADLYNYDGILKLDQPLLEPETITDFDDTTLTMWEAGDSRANYITATVTGIPRLETPYWWLRKISDGYAISWARETGLISVLGYWGYRSDYNTKGWRTSTQPLTVAVSSTSQSTLTFADVDAADIRGVAPMYSVGNLLRIAEGNNTEFVRVTSIDSETAITVERGVNGTTAQNSFTTDATISRWYPENAIVQATARWAGFVFKERSQFMKTRREDLSDTVFTFPDWMPADVKSDLDLFPGSPGDTTPMVV